MADTIEDKLTAGSQAYKERKARENAAGKLPYHDPVQDSGAFLHDALREAAKQHKSIQLPNKTRFPEDYQTALANPAGGLAMAVWQNPKLLAAIQQQLWPKAQPPAPPLPSASVGPGAAASPTTLNDILKAKSVDPFQEMLDMAKTAAKSVADPNAAVPLQIKPTSSGGAVGPGAKPVMTGGRLRQPNVKAPIQEVDLLPTMANGQKHMKPMSKEGKALLLDLMKSGKVYGSEMLPSQNPQGRRYNPGGQADADATFI